MLACRNSVCGDGYQRRYCAADPLVLRRCWCCPPVESVSGSRWARLPLVLLVSLAQLCCGAVARQCCCAVARLCCGAVARLCCCALARLCCCAVVRLMQLCLVQCGCGRGCSVTLLRR